MLLIIMLESWQVKRTYMINLDNYGRPME